MSSLTALKPHAISCIKQSVYDLLVDKSGDNLTVSCDRDDCWADAELFKWRKAINIVTRADIIGAPVRRGGKLRPLGVPKVEDYDQCWHDATLAIDIQIYVEKCDSKDDCMDGKGMAYGILGHVTSVLTSYQSEILGNRILYQGATHQSSSEGEVDVDVVTGSFQISYLFDQTRPWVVGK